MNRIVQYLKPPVYEDDRDKTYFASLLNVFSLATVSAALVATVFVIAQGSALSGLAIGAAIGLLVLCVQVLMRRDRVRLASLVQCAGLWLLITAVGLASGGVHATILSAYVLVIFMSGLLLGGRAGIVAAGLSVASGLAMWIAGSRGLLVASVDVPASSAWMVQSIVFALAAVMVYVNRHGTRKALALAYRNEHALTESYRELETRTLDLERLTRQLQAGAEVRHAAANVHDPDALLSQVSERIGEQFGFYHVGIFMLDVPGDYAVLCAATSVGGQQMLANGHRLRVGVQGIVGYVTASGEARIALDVGADPVHFDNPLLPETRSEMALPLKVGTRILGALDVQSVREAAFGEDDILALQAMADQLAIAHENARLLQAVQNTARELSSAASELLIAATEQASGASEQSASIAETSTTVDEVRTIAEQSVTRAREVADAARRTMQVSRTGQRSVEETIDSMDQIKVRVEGIAENILALSEQTQQIGEIISTVNDIAAQSNMLALNASVEAARAGEHGKGFSVVAVEVRNLAEQSRQATAQVKAILSDIQHATNATVMATEEGTKGVATGVETAAQAQAAIEQLSDVIDESAQAAAQMVAGGQQQASGVEQISVAMRNINQATVQGMASTRQAEKAAQNLSKLARSLNEIMEQYRT